MPCSQINGKSHILLPVAKVALTNSSNKESKSNVFSAFPKTFQQCRQVPQDAVSSFQSPSFSTSLQHQGPLGITKTDAQRKLQVDKPTPKNGSTIVEESDQNLPVLDNLTPEPKGQLLLDTLASNRRANSSFINRPQTGELTRTRRPVLQAKINSSLRNNKTKGLFELDKQTTTGRSPWQAGRPEANHWVSLRKGNRLPPPQY
jgi:hypothetical protein